MFNVLDFANPLSKVMFKVKHQSLWQKYVNFERLNQLKNKNDVKLK